MARDYTAVPHEYLDEMGELSDEEFGRLMRILLKYSQTGEKTPPAGNERFYFKRVLNTEDRYQKSFDKVDEERTAKARAAANARWNNANACTSMPEHAQANQAMLNDACDAYIKPETETDIKPKPNIPPQSPPGGNAFADFWEAYPKKVGKQAALKAWSKLKPNAELTQSILKAVEYQRTMDAWQKEGGRYIPNPATWLNQGRWEDEIRPIAVAPSQPRKAQPCPADYGMPGTTVDRGDIDWLLKEGLV